MFADGDTPVFLTRLGLTSDTDKQAVRRAYSHELKQIDQETDAASFQALREAYDAALAWLDRVPVTTVTRVNNSTVPKFRPERVIAVLHTKELPKQAPVERIDKADGAAQMGAEVFAEFEVTCERLASDTNATDEFYWKTALGRHLDDKRLLNLDARTIFERSVAQRLAVGWVPGNETLLLVAADQFGWMADRRTLALLGRPGALLDQALKESLIFEAQPMPELLIQRQLIQRLREIEPPDELQISIDITHLERMLLRFPNWLPIVADKRTVMSWQRIHLSSFGAENDITSSDDNRDRAVKSKGLSGPANHRFLQSLMLVLFVGTIWLAEHFSPHHQPLNVSQPSGAAIVYSVNPAPGLPPSDTTLNEIQSRINYQPAKLVGIQLQAQFEIVLSNTGEVANVIMVSPSGIPAFDNLVESEIRATRKFPSETQRIFKASFTNAK